jgi:hypothetical protein
VPVEQGREGHTTRPGKTENAKSGGAMINKKKTPAGVMTGLGQSGEKNLFKKNTDSRTPCQPITAAAQRRRILEYLQLDTLTTLQARSMGIMHPGARVMELRKQGHEIITEWVMEYCPGGVRHRVALYRLKMAGGEK